MGKAWRCALLGLACLFNCKPGGTTDGGSLPPGTVTRIRLEQDVSVPLVVPRNNTVTLDVWTEFEDGKPADGAVVQTTLFGQSDALVQAQPIETGHVRLTIGPLHLNTLVNLTSRICPDGDFAHCDGGSVATLNQVRVTVYGGFPATRLVHGPLDLSVGETRPIRLAAVATGAPNSPFSFLTDRDVSMSSSDGRVLEVEGLVIKGLSPGTVTLTMTGPGLTETTQVTVRSAQDAGLRTLTNEALVLQGGPVLGLNAGMRMQRGSLFESVVFDRANNPVILARVTAPTQLVHTLAESVDTVLARWTGTGWGAEAPFKDWMSIYFPVVVKDERNHVYVGAFDKNRGMYVIAERDLDDLGDPFTYHYVPAPAFLAANTIFPEQAALTVGRGGGFTQQSVSRLSDWITLYPRNGGGVHFAVTPSYKATNCHRVLTVGTLSPTGLLTHEERETTQWKPSASGFCDWQGPGGLPNGELHWEPPATRSGEPTMVVTRFYRSTPSEAWATRTINGQPAPGIEQVRLTSMVEGQYRFDDGDRTVYAGVAGTGFRVFDASGASSLDNAGEVLFGAVSGHLLQQSSTWVSGIGSRASTFVAVHEGVIGGEPIVAVMTLPPAAPLVGSEVATDGLAGLRIGGVAHPAPVTSVAVMPDGKRVALVGRLGFESALRTTWPGVYRSDTAGTPWAAVEDRAIDTFDPALPMRRQGAKLYTVSHDPAGLISANLHVSSDNGDTWQTEGIFVRINERRPLVAHVFANGVRLVVSGQPGGLGRTMHLQLRDEGATSWRDVSEWVAPTLTFWNQSEAAAVEAADGSVSVMTIAAEQLMSGMPQRYRLVIREYDAAGQYQRTRDLIVPPGVRLHTATRLPDGDLFFFGGQYGERFLPVTYSLRVDAVTDGVTQTMLPAAPELYVHSPGVVLNNGTIVIGGDRVGTDGPVAARYTRSMYMTSSDGVTFSAPVDVRPAGGRAQATYALAKETDGVHVLFVIGDAATLWSEREYAFRYGDIMLVNALTAPLVPMSVRVAP